MRAMKKVIFALTLLVIILLPRIAFAESKSAVVYYSKYCSDCEIYLERELKPFLQNKGYEVQVRDYITDKEAQQQLSKQTSNLNIPKKLIGHMMTFINGKVILAGHVPLIHAEAAINKKDELGKILLFQDEMHGEPKSYKIWLGRGVKEFPINESFENHLNEVSSGKSKTGTLLPVVVSGAFLDSLNPCAFAVLLSFIAFLLLLGQKRSVIFRMGSSYITAIFIAYLLIGLGILSFLSFFGQSHFMGKSGAVILILIGLVGLINIFIPKLPLRLPHFDIPKETVKNLMIKSTIGASFAVGFLVGLCTFPCSGGPYVAILTLLSSQTSAGLGFIYLILYNFIFILPLVIILFVVSNKKTAEAISNLRERNAQGTKIMVSLGSLILGGLIWTFI